MLGRRRHPRFLLAEPIEGIVQIREDITVEQWNDREVVVLSPEPCRIQERLRLEVPGRFPRRIDATVLESRPVVVDDSVIRHRLRLAIDSNETESALA